MRLLIKLGPNAIMPKRMHGGDAGIDLYVSERVTVPPGKSVDIPTDVCMQMPEGVWGMIIGRSSTIRKYNLQVGIGVIDNGYRGELFINVTNHQDNEMIIESGVRLAQFILFDLVQPDMLEVDILDEGDRGDAGFGSTGR